MGGGGMCTELIFISASVVTIKKVAGAGRARTIANASTRRAFIAKHNFELMWPLLPQLYEQPLVPALCNDAELKTALTEALFFLLARKIMA